MYKLANSQAMLNRLKNQTATHNHHMLVRGSWSLIDCAAKMPKKQFKNKATIIAPKLYYTG